MAKDAVDAAAAALDGRVPKSVTKNTPLVGADGYQARWNQRHLIAQRSGLHVARIEHLLNRYGGLIDEVLALVREDPSLGQQLAGTQDYLKAEIVYAARSEGARHLDDVLARRTRISIEAWDRGVEAADAAARLIAPILGWTSRRSSGRSRSTAAGSSPNATPRTSPTTSPPTRSASKPPTSSRPPDLLAYVRRTVGL